MRKRQAIGFAPVLVLLAQHPAWAQPLDAVSANYMMSGCRSALASENKNYVGQGCCLGAVAMIFHFAETHFGICTPDGVTIGQAVRVVVIHIDQRPTRLRGRFDDLAVEALQQAWPCRR
jgi:Rap1a immunity proteins